MNETVNLDEQFSGRYIERTALQAAQKEAKKLGDADQDYVDQWIADRALEIEQEMMQAQNEQMQNNQPMAIKVNKRNQNDRAFRYKLKAGVTQKQLTEAKDSGKFSGVVDVLETTLAETLELGDEWHNNPADAINNVSLADDLTQQLAQADIAEIAVTVGKKPATVRKWIDEGVPKTQREAVIAAL